jgi:hypothetical protein
MKFATKKAKKAGKKAAAPDLSMNAPAAAAHMEGLISAHASTAQDGRFEVATAIAMTSSLVTVTANGDTFSTKPDNLFALTFSDNKVGITTPDLMRVFLANLKVLLPQIGDTIDQIPENPAIQIEKVALLVRLALLQG